VGPEELFPYAETHTHKVHES